MYGLVLIGGLLAAQELKEGTVWIRATIDERGDLHDYEALG
jgi:hypothetical protein